MVKMTLSEEMEKALAPVRKVKLTSGSEGAGHYLLDCEDKEICKVSDRYELVQNRDIFMPLLEKFGKDSVDEVLHRGKSFNFKIRTGRTFDIGTGDKIAEQIVGQNSYDKTRSYKFMFGAFRFICSNGMFVGHAQIAFRKIHVGDIPVEQMVKEVLANYEKNNFETWNKMRKIKVPLKSSLDFIKRHNAFEVEEKKGGAEITKSSNEFLNTEIRRRAVELVSGEETVNNPRNVWGLFNQLNQAISRSVRARDINKVILGNKNFEDALIKKYELN
jgi:hypothetical protein